MAIGKGTLATNTTGAANTAIGNQALLQNTTASNNTAVGYQAGYSNTTGAAITAIGAQALYSNTTGNNNTAIGYYSLYTNQTGTTNVALGRVAGYSTTSNGNTFIGDAAGYTSNSNNSIYGNTCVGASAGYNLTTGYGNQFFGGGYNPAGFNMTTGNLITIICGFIGNTGGLDIRTSNNYIVLADGAGNIGVYFDNAQQAVFSATVRTAGYLVANLPTGVTGMRAHVTNALAPTFGATVVGGGAVTIPVFYNGSNWIVA